MGKNNRARRAAKARAKASRAPSSSASSARSARLHPPLTGSSTSGGPPIPEPEVIAHLLHAAARARAAGETGFVEAAEVELCRRDVVLVRAVATEELARAVATAWSGGWQPAELARHARRTTTATAAGLIAVAMAADHSGRPRESLDPRWLEQIEAAGLPEVTGTEWIRRWSAGLGLGRFSEVETIIESLQCLTALPMIEELIPPPGGSTRRAHRAEPVVPAVPASAAERATLAKIRALLAKAESTTYEAEAEAFTAKAQQLMTRHAIDAATLAGATGGEEQPVAIRVWIDDPYVDAKSLLLQLVAQASRCRTVFFSDISATTLLGFRAEVTAVELLYTSLLVQAQTSLTNAARALPAGSRQRTRSFRSSFLLAYAHRIGERLEAAGAEVIVEAEAEAGRSLLPVLQSRQLAVDEAVQQRYGALSGKRVRGGHDPAGWASGTRAADAAEFVAGAIASRRSAG